MHLGWFKAEYFKWIVFLKVILIVQVDQHCGPAAFDAVAAGVIGMEMAAANKQQQQQQLIIQQ